MPLKQSLKVSRYFIMSACAALVACTTTQTAIPLSQDNDSFVVSQKQNFINNIAPKYGLTRQETAAALDKATFQPKIIKLISKPAEHKNWGQYQALLVTPQRATEGKKFIQGNAGAFSHAEAKYHVPRQIVAAIIGVETNYGKNTGGFKVLDALSTLGFGYAPRTKFFQQELAEYLVLVKKNNWPVDSVKGSYAGAFGLSQFMPSSYKNFAVDENGEKNTPDLVNNPTHVIMSTAHYLHQNGWQPGGLVAIPVQITPKTCEKLTCQQRKPNYTVQTWLENGVTTNRVLPKQAKASLILLTTEKGQEAWLTFNNFYVITRYNTSFNYAMAVYQISEQIKRAK